MREVFKQTRKKIDPKKLKFYNTVSGLLFLEKGGGGVNKWGVWLQMLYEISWLQVFKINVLVYARILTLKSSEFMAI